MNQLEIKLALKDWRSIVNQYQKPDTRKAILQIFTSFLPFIGIWVLMYFSLDWHYGITLGLAFIAAFFLVRIFIIQHDCGHQSFFKSRSWNHTIGFFSSFFSTLPYHYWARVHKAHHGYNGQLEHRGIGDTYYMTSEEYRQAPTWKKIVYRGYRTPLMQFIIAPIIYLVISNRYPFQKALSKGNLKWLQLVNNLSTLLVYGLLAMFLGWKQFLLVHIPILFIFSVIAFWFFYIQHQHEENYNQWKGEWDFVLASILGSTFYKLPRLFHWLTGNIGYHHIHHLNSRIPSYHLKTCAEENPILTKYVPTLTFLESIKCMTYKLWDEQDQKMITFGEFRRKEVSGA